MNRDPIWQVIDAQRRRLADLLDDLSADEWRQPSLCARWTVRDDQVARERRPGNPRLRLPGRGGSVDDRIVPEIRGMIGSRRHSVGVTHLETLTDILVHGQDIAIPLGRPSRHAGRARRRHSRVDHAPVRRLPAARKVAGFRVVATDSPWSAGEGLQVQGPMAALLLVSAGRLVALPQLSGAGAADLAARLSEADGPGGIEERR